MKEKGYFLLITLWIGAERVLAGLSIAVVLVLLSSSSPAHAASVNLGSDTNFAVLAGAGITSTGPTTINGNIGTYPVPSVTTTGGFTLNGVNQTSDTGIMLTAKSDLATAFADAAGRPATTSYTGAAQIGGLTLVPGVYDAPVSMNLTGTLTLNGQGASDGVWIFQTGSSLITGSDAAVILENGAQACHVFWEVGSSATLGTDTAFVGNLLALTSITANTGASVDGRLLAENGSVTLDNNVITESFCNSNTTGGGGPASAQDTGSSLLLLGSAVAILFAARRKLFR
jgi:hypothetical protein